MRICFIADIRSPIAQNWIGYFIKNGNDVQVISSYPCDTELLPGAVIHPVPIALACLSKISHSGTVDSRARVNNLKHILAPLHSGRLSGVTRKSFEWLASFELIRHTSRIRGLITDFQPDIVHAMRIPFEGIMAVKATPPDVPVLASVWGNDFTLHGRNPVIRRQIKTTLQRITAIHTDCYRDLRLAQKWGYSDKKPSIVLPGAGGVQLNIFFPGEGNTRLLTDFDIPLDFPRIINPRGIRGYVRNDIFFQAIPCVLKHHPKACFICTGMQGNPVVEKWIRQFGIEDNVRLLPKVQRSQMAELFRIAHISVSPSLHDGTPNTLLEAMACGCFPVAGNNVESIEEWIEHGTNGFLCDANSHTSLADAISAAIDNTELRDKARAYNFALVMKRAEYQSVMHQAEQFYVDIVN